MKTIYFITSVRQVVQTHEILKHVLLDHAGDFILMLFSKLAFMWCFCALYLKKYSETWQS